MVIKSLLFSKSSLLHSTKIVGLAGIIISSVVLVNAQIDEKMPGTIPKEILDDWKAQGGTAEEIKKSLPAEYAAKCDGTFESACHWRRVYRMKQFPFLKRIMFARHHNLGAIAIGFWVNVGSADVTDTYFKAEGALCLLNFDNYYSQYKEILTKDDACVRDPCISLDGKKVVFAMSGNGKGTGYLLYEMEIDNPGKVKQLTQYPAGLKVADFEPCYLPNGDIMFASTRCFGVIDCGWQPTTNMFVMNGEGKYLRRISFDQVHVGYPVLRPDGTVMYWRWEYNDRDIANICGLFTMNPDGSHQTELFGNQTTWPMLFVQGRPVPGNPNKYFAIASGHHGDYSGEALIVDISKGSNGPENVQMISPPRKTETRDKNDNFAFGGIYRNSEYPYPLNEEWYLVGYREENQLNSMSRISISTPFKIYLKHIDGKSRELLAWGNGSLHHPVVVAPWKEIWGSDPFPVAEQANFNDSMGIFTMQDVYVGEGMKGVKRGVAKRLRVVALKYRVSGACQNGWAGQVLGAKPADVIFSAPAICPVSLWGGSWDVKIPLGETPINPDGSAAFKVPARTPVYFQVLDSNGCMIATMRSWATLMPGEVFSCVGCHESKAEAPATGNNALAAKAQKLETPLGIENQGFDYPKFVQPILDKHCVKCHTANHSSGLDMRGDLVYNNSAKKSYATSYSSFFKGIGASKSNKAINIATIFSQAPQLPPYSHGSTKSGIIKNVLSGHKDVKLTDKEIRILACWIDCEAPHAPAYDAYMNESDAKRYKELEATAKKCYDIEAQNVKEYAAYQRTRVNFDGKKSKNSAIYVQKPLNVVYNSQKHTLVLQKESIGIFKLVDLKGRIIYRTIIPEGNVTISLPSSLGCGLYIARFEGEDGIEQATISVQQ